jgi:hypothetical protein
VPPIVAPLAPQGVRSPRLSAQFMPHCGTITTIVRWSVFQPRGVLDAELSQSSYDANL